MADKKRWDGKGKGSALGNLIFIKTITLLGTLPAYILLLLIACYYTLFDRAGIRALRKFRKRVGFKHTTLWHLYKHFFSFGMVLIDRVAFSIIKKPPFKFTFINDKIISDTLAQGKGVIVISAHIGNWEIAGNLIADRFNTATYAVIMDNEKQKVKEVFKEVTEKRRFKTILISQDGLDMMVPIKEALNNNGIVCFHGDRVINSPRVKLPFLGETAEFPPGPFQIAAITGTSIIPVFLLKKGMYHFATMTYAHIPFDNITRENRDSHIRKAMELYVSILEDIAKKHPYQWFNFYDIWA